MEAVVMNNEDMNSIFEQINNLKKPSTESKEQNAEKENDTLREVLNGVSEEIQRVLDENNFTQEDLCQITKMSQSNISKIQNSLDLQLISTRTQEITNKCKESVHISSEIHHKSSHSSEENKYERSSPKTPKNISKDSENSIKKHKASLNK